MSKIENKDILIKTKDFNTVIKKRRWKIFRWSLIALLGIAVFTIVFHIFIIWPYLEMKHRQVYLYYKDNLNNLIYDNKVDEFKEIFKLINYYEKQVQSFINTCEFDVKTANEMYLYIFVSYGIIALVISFIFIICIGRLKMNDLDTTFAEMGELGKTQILSKIQESLKEK